MEDNHNIATDLGKMYEPKSALVIYQTKETTPETYVEHFDMDKQGMPINAHPLSVREAEKLAKMLKTREQTEKAYLQSQGLLPNNILQIKLGGNGTVIWFSKPQKRQLFFIESLGIPNGIANVPTLLWKATANSISVYAVKTNRRPTANTPLYYAPFFNVYENGNVCMGTVEIEMQKVQCLEDFINDWEQHFFNSYFSHLLDSYCPTKLNTVTLWKELINTDKPFPTNELKKNNRTLKDLL